MNLKAKKIIAREFFYFLFALAIGTVSYLLIFPYNFYLSNKIKNIDEKISLNLISSENLLISSNKKQNNQHWFTLKWEYRFGKSIYAKGGNPLQIWNDSTSEISYVRSKGSAKNLHTVLKKNRNLDSLSAKIPPYKSRFEISDSDIRKFNIEISIDELVSTDANRIWCVLYSLAQKDSIVYKWNNAWSVELVDFIKECGFRTSDIFKDFVEKNMIDSKDLALQAQSHLVGQEIAGLTTIKNNFESKLFDTNHQNKFGLMIFLIALFLLFVGRYFIYSFKWSLNIIKQKDEKDL